MINPKAFVLNMIQKTRNPILNNLISLEPSKIESFARNFCKEKGVDFDKEFNEFMQRMR